MGEVCIGLMSGTSLDGIDVAVARVDRNAVELADYVCLPYSPAQRETILATIHSGGAREVAELDMQLGRWFGEAAHQSMQRLGLGSADVDLIASHGQTVWHTPGRATLQLGQPALVAELTGVTVITDFRPRDVAAGGQGAPLVPIADAMLFAGGGNRVLLNLGGIANVTWVPTAGELDAVLAFDTGPGMAVTDAIYRRTEGDSGFDDGGSLAASGTAIERVVVEALEHRYFAGAPPKSTGRETFGDEYATALLASVRDAGGSDADALATSVRLTAASAADQMRRWLPAVPADVVVSGGGARNRTLMSDLSEMIAAPVKPFDDLYFDGDAKEAVAFAYLGWLTLQGLPGNVPSATGASGARVLGRITPP